MSCEEIMVVPKSLPLLPEHTRSMHTKGLLIVLFFLGVYLLTAQGSIQTSDVMSMFLLTQSIAEKGSLSIESARTDVLSEGKGEKFFSKYGVGQPLLAVPLYLAGVAVTNVSGIPKRFTTLFAVSLFNSIISSLVCIVLFFCAVEMGYSQRIALCVSSAYGMSTVAWHYSQDFMSEPLTALFFILALYLTLKAAAGSARSYFYVGCALGGALLVRPASAVAVPCYLIFILLKEKDGERGRRLLQGLGYFLTGCVPFVAGVLWYNFIRFGSIADAGYQSHGFTTPLWVGMAGHLITPGKSIFLYNPFLLITVVGFYDFIKARPKEALLVCLIFLSHLVLYSKWDVWTGGMCWGSRFLLVTFPYLMVSAGVFLEKRGTFWRAVAIVLFLAGVIVQLPSLVVNVSRYHYTLRLQYRDAMMDRLIYTAHDSPLIGQWKEVKKVIADLKNRDYLKELTSYATQQKSFTGAGDEELLKYGLALNVPNVWWVYLYLYGFPLRVILPLVCFLITIALISGAGILRRVVSSSECEGKIQ